MKKNKKEYFLLAILMICFIILTMFVVFDKTFTVDKYIFDNLINIKNDLLTKILYSLTKIGSLVGVMVILIITMFMFLKRKKLSYFKYVLINVLLGTVVMEILKNIIKRIRPSWKWIVQGGFSYPSGHTISAVLLYGTLMLLVNKLIKDKNKNVLTIFFACLMILIPLSRIYFGVHYFTDVMAGYIIGFIILIISNIFINKEVEHDKNKNRKEI